MFKQKVARSYNKLLIGLNHIQRIITLVGIFVALPVFVVYMLNFNPSENSSIQLKPNRVFQDQQNSRTGRKMGVYQNYTAYVHNFTTPWYTCFNSSETLISSKWNKDQLGYILEEMEMDRRNTIQWKNTKEKLLNARRLTLVATQLINKEIKPNPLCVKWWTNPLSLTLTSVSSSSVEGGVVWKLNFYLEPGRVNVKVALNQYNFSRIPTFKNSLYQQEFKLRSAHVKTFGKTDNLQNMCLCKTGFKEANYKSTAAREEWKQSDPELNAWPPNSSFMITDYIDYLDHDFFLANPTHNEDNYANYCGPKLRLIVAIHSAPPHLELRSAIRQTWGIEENMRKFNAQLVFFLGTTDSITQTLVNQEIEQFGDIVQANFVDHYQNLTLKRLTVFQWIYLKCSNTRSRTMPELILKADDDYIINIGLALKIMDYNPNASFIGVGFCGTEVVRDPAYQDKYYLPRYVYPSKPYDAYLSGTACISRSTVIPSILEASLTVPFHHVDDAFFGMLSRMLKIPIHGSSLFSYETAPQDSCSLKSVVMSNVSDSKDMLQQWNIFLEPVPKDCTLSDLNLSAIAC